MTNKLNRFGFLLLMILIVAVPAWAVPVELQFTNADVDLGLNSVIPVTNEYTPGFGIVIADAYRYIDGRDPFSDAPNDVAGPDCPNPNASGRCNFGLSNNHAELYATIQFLTPTPVSFDWWVLGGAFANFIVRDSGGAVLADFSPNTGESGTFTTNELVGSVTWLNDFVGFSQVANIRYELEGRVPEPGTLLLLGLGLAGLGLRRRR